jgi:hypothetical protein
LGRTGVTPREALRLEKAVDEVLLWSGARGPVGEDWLLFERLAKAERPLVEDCSQVRELMRRQPAVARDTPEST